MSELLESIEQFEGQIEQALTSLEIPGEIEKALAVYQNVEVGLEALSITNDQPEYPEYQRVLAYCLMRESNLLRQLDRSQEAMTISEREIVAARASGNSVTLARSLMSFGVNLFVAGKVEKGQRTLDESRLLFEKGESYDEKQGLGWIWIIQADLINAGFIAGIPKDVLDAAGKALELLLPIENWPGVARAYEARAKAYEVLGDSQSAAADREEQKNYESKIETKAS